VTYEYCILEQIDTLHQSNNCFCKKLNYYYTFFCPPEDFSIWLKNNSYVYKLSEDEYEKLLNNYKVWQTDFIKNLVWDKEILEAQIQEENDMEQSLNYNSSDDDDPFLLERLVKENMLSKSALEPSTNFDNFTINGDDQKITYLSL